jgi:hypothetical protein
MALYVHNGTSFVSGEVTSSDRIYVHNGTSFDAGAVKNAYIHNGAGWQQVWQYDATAPTISAFTTSGQTNGDIQFAWTGGALVTDSESGVTQVLVQQQYTPYGGSGEGWNTVANWTSGEWAASSGSFVTNPPATKRRQQSQATFPYPESVSRYYSGYRVIAYDAAGNSSTSGEVACFTKPYGPWYLVPQVVGDSYQTGVGFYGLTTASVRSGDATGLGGLNWAYGCWFYGDLIEDTHLVRDASGNRYAANSGTLAVQRYQSQGTSGTWAFQPHNLRYSNGATGATFTGNIVTAAISGTDASATIALDSSHFTAFSNLTAKGFGMVRNGSTNYRVIRNFFEDFSPSGRIILDFS